MIHWSKQQPHPVSDPGRAKAFTIWHARKCILFRIRDTILWGFRYVTHRRKKIHTRPRPLFWTVFVCQCFRMIFHHTVIVFDRKNLIIWHWEWVCVSTEGVFPGHHLGSFNRAWVQTHGLMFLWVLLLLQRFRNQWINSLITSDENGMEPCGYC